MTYQQKRRGKLFCNKRTIAGLFMMVMVICGLTITYGALELITTPTTSERGVVIEANPQPLLQAELISPVTTPNINLRTNGVLEEDLNQRLTGLLYHMRWLLAEQLSEHTVDIVSDDNLSDQVNRLERQLFSLMDDTNDDRRKLSDELTTDGTFTTPTLSDSTLIGTTTADILTANQLGVGTTSPSDTMAVAGAVYLDDTTPPSTLNRLYNTTGDLYWSGNLIGGSTVGNWTSNGADVWRVSGNVGIGTTSPNEVLEVVGNTNITGNLVTGGQGNALFIGSGGVTHIGFGWNNIGTYHSFHTSGATNENVKFSLVDPTNQYLNVDGHFESQHSVAIGYSTETSLSVPTGGLAVAGNVGIGTTSPYAKLSVTNIGSSPSFIVEDSTSPDSTPFIIDGNGNVGIGTTSPDGKLDIWGTSYFGDSGTNAVRIDDGEIGMQDTVNSGRSLRIEATDIISGGSNSHTYNYSDGGQLVSVSDVNNTLLLDVGGRVSTDSAFRISLDSTGNHPIVNLANKDTDISTLYANSSTGNVGIGTANPSAKLQLNGSAVSAGGGDHDNFIINHNSGATGAHSSIGLYAENDNVPARITYGDGSDNMGWLAFEVDNSWGTETTDTGTVMYLHKGRVGIGTTSIDHLSERLTVDGNVYASSFIDDGITIGAPDYVFDDPAYTHLTIEEIDAFIEENDHLPWLTPRGSGAMSLSTRINEVLEALENLFLKVFELVDWNKEQDAKDIELEAEIAELRAIIEDLTNKPLPDNKKNTEPIEDDEDNPPTDQPDTASSSTASNASSTPNTSNDTTSTTTESEVMEATDEATNEGESEIIIKEDETPLETVPLESDIVESDEEKLVTDSGSAG